MGVLVLVGGLFAGAQSASAAPTVTYPGAISNLAIENASASGPLEVWHLVKITGDWSVPAGAVAGDTFGMTLPTEFGRSTARSFTITDPATGVVMATCQVAAGHGPDMVCTLTAAVEGMENVGGSFWLESRAVEATTSETVQFDLGNQVAAVDLPGDGGITPVNPAEPGSPYKYGDPTVVDGRLFWTIGIPSSAVGDGTFTVKDTLDGSLEKHSYTGELHLMRSQVENGVFVGDWTEVDPSFYQVVYAPDGGSFDFTASGLPTSGYSYRLQYYTKAADIVLPGDVFGNHAVVNTTTVSATTTVTENGGGDGAGVTYTRFTITKALTGEQAAAAQDATFTVEYSVKGSDAPAQTMSVKVGQPATSMRAPLGSTYIVREIDLPVIDGVEWGDWTLTGDGVVAVGDGSYEVTPATHTGVELTLTNVANTVPVLGSVSWSKVNGAGVALSGSEWTLTGPEGVVAVIDNGDRDADSAAGALSVTDLAAGTYTLAETKAPTGYVRTDETFTVTIDADHRSVSYGEIVNVRTPQVSSENPEPPSPPTPPTTPTAAPTELPLTGGTSGLAQTGGSGNAELLWGALALMLVGGISVVARRRRETAS